MPLQNRVNPYGAIFSSTARGTFMGNRGGALHNGERVIIRSFKDRRWITCVLEFKGRWRAVMSPNRYTELFFLDEAVSLAAGHRPCAECRRERFNAFRAAWMRSHEPEGKAVPLAPEIDREIHRARMDRQGRKVTFEAPLLTLPDGCFVEIDNLWFLVSGEALLQWSPAGYIEKRPRPDVPNVRVLTPEPVVQCIRDGYQPVIHDSAMAL